MRVVLFGSGGFIGQYLAATLSARGHHVVVATRDRETVKNNLILLPNTDVIACDYNQAQTVHPLLDGADVAVNLIGILNGALSRKVRSSVLWARHRRHHQARDGRFALDCNHKR